MTGDAYKSNRYTQVMQRELEKCTQEGEIDKDVSKSYHNPKLDIKNYQRALLRSCN